MRLILFLSLTLGFAASGTRILCPDGYSRTRPDWECDGDDDCGDMSEEQVCEQEITTLHSIKPADTCNEYLLGGI